MRVSWMRQARKNFIDAHEFIAEDDPAAADRFSLLIVEGVQQLAQFPSMGRVGRVEGTREWVIAGTSYIVAYRIRPRSIAIVAVMHGSQRWPSSFRH